jgi:hypothetical protein
MYSGKIAVPPGGGGIRNKLLKSVTNNCVSYTHIVHKFLILGLG